MSFTYEQRLEAIANLTLWCVSVVGPGDVYAEPSHASAVAKADELNHAVWANDRAPDRDILCFAYADIWPWSAESHAKDMQENAEREAAKRNPSL